MQRKFQSAEALSLQYQRTHQQQFPRGVTGDWRLAEIPERAQLSAGDLRNFELWIQSEATQPLSAADMRHRHVWGSVEGRILVTSTKKMEAIVVADFLLCLFQKLIFPPTVTT